MLRTYGKSIVALLGAAGAAIQVALTDGSISGAEWVGIVIALATGGAAWAAPYRPTVRAKPLSTDAA